MFSKKKLFLFHKRLENFQRSTILRMSTLVTVVKSLLKLAVSKIDHDHLPRYNLSSLRSANMITKQVRKIMSKILFFNNVFKIKHYQFGNV